MPSSENTSGKDNVANNAVVDGFYSKYIKPILGKVAMWLVLLLLVFMVGKIFLGSFKRDHSLEVMQQQIDAKDAEIKQIIAGRDSLNKYLAESKKVLIAMNQRDSTLAASVEQLNSGFAKIKSTYNEKVKTIEHYNSTDLELYYHTLPDDY